MNPIFPVIELIDRLAIAEVKFKRTAGGNKEEHVQSYLSNWV